MQHVLVKRKMIGTSVRKKTLGRPRSKSENNVKMDAKDTMLKWTLKIQC